jgi:hypothetical protein
MDGNLTGLLGDCDSSENLSNSKTCCCGCHGSLERCSGSFCVSVSYSLATQDDIRDMLAMG